MKKITKKLVVIAIFCILSSFMLTGCGSTKEDNTSNVEDGAKQSTDKDAGTDDSTANQVYTTGMNESIQEGDWYPQWMFFKTISSIRMIQAGETWTLTLEVDGDNNYTLTSQIGNSDEGVIEGDASYHLAKTVATGTCTVEDGTITIDKPSYVEYELGVGEFMEPYIEPWSYNNEPGNYAGKWTSDEVPELIDIVPVTVFKVNESKIEDFECEGIEDLHEGKDMETGEDIVETTGEDSSSDTEKESLFQQVSDGGSTYLDFYQDNTYKFSFPDQDISEDGTWAYDEGTEVLTLTTPNGKECVSSKTEDSKLFLDFKTDMNDALGGKFNFDFTEFTEALLSAVTAQ